MGIMSAFADIFRMGPPDDMDMSVHVIFVGDEVVDDMWGGGQTHGQMVFEYGMVGAEDITDKGVPRDILTEGPIKPKEVHGPVLMDVQDDDNLL